jgi:hypothetical protein
MQRILVPFQARSVDTREARDKCDAEPVGDSVVIIQPGLLCLLVP